MSKYGIPAAQSDAYQEVRVVSAKGDLPLKKKDEDCGQSAAAQAVKSLEKELNP